MIRKIIFLVLFLAALFAAFSQNNDMSTFMVELNAGYSVGINLDNAIQTDIRLYYPYKKFGFVIEAGGLFSTDNSTFHLFLGPMMYFINNEKWRLPLIIGFDFMGGNADYFGIGGVITLHRKLTNYLYAGLNLGIVYIFDSLYDELTGYKIVKEVVDDGTGNAVFAERTVPMYENKHHYGNNFYLKPSLVIGLQF